MLVEPARFDAKGSNKPRLDEESLKTPSEERYEGLVVVTKEELHKAANSTPGEVTSLKSSSIGSK